MWSKFSKAFVTRYVLPSLVIRIECKRTRFFTGYELIYCILKCLHIIQKKIFFFFVFKDKVICLLVRQSQYTVITYRGLHKKYKYETLVKADSFDVRKEFLGITCGMDGGEMRTPSKRKSDKSFETCRLNNLGSPVLSAGQFFRREIASFLFRCAQPKRG